MKGQNMTEPFTHGADVVVLSSRGDYEFRGKIAGVHMCNPWQYDVQPRGEISLAKRVCGVHHARIRRVSNPILAYERQDNEPKHIKDMV